MIDYQRLTPAELATLWVSATLDRSGDQKPIVLSSEITNVLLVALAEGYSRVQDEELAVQALETIALNSRDLVSHIADRGGYIRFDNPVRSLLDKLDSIGFPILPEVYVLDIHEDRRRSRSSICYDLASQSYKKAVLALETEGLIIDPPWYKSTAATGALIILLGSVPLEINVKTVEGQAVTTSIEAKFWSYEKNVNNGIEDLHLNIRIAEFLNKVIQNLGEGFVDAWKESNPDRVSELERQALDDSKEN
jgi:hypothetical protein